MIFHFWQKVKENNITNTSSGEEGAPIDGSDFFIEGGLNFPKKIDSSKTIKELTDEDYIKFFEELGWKFISICEYNPEIHIKQAILKNHDTSNDAQA